MRKDDRVRLQHMLDAAREALAFAGGPTRADLGEERVLVLSPVKDVEIIGEAAYQVSDITPETNATAMAGAGGLRKETAERVQ